MAEKKETEAREHCPGMMLFRKTTAKDMGVNDPYEKGLLVFLVSEQPTGGLTSSQWDIAVGWIKGSTGDKPLRILGPTFSGTLPSLAVKLAALKTLAPDSTWGDNALVFSGTLGSCKSVKWFQGKKSKGTRLRVFQENDEIQLKRLFEYMKSQGEHLDDVAILSEDETAYGGSLEREKTTTDSDDGCELSRYYKDLPLNGRPVSLFYPRDISALRAAYQSQSIFSQDQPEGEKHNPRTVLSDDLENEVNEEGDTPANYSTQQSALTEEAELYGAVSFLRAHHSRFVILRGSNPLDYLFLARFLHHAYPEGRVIVVGSEILFTRELDTTEFRGSLALTNFPLLPRLQHWSQVFKMGQDGEPGPIPEHGHRVFPSTNAEALYIASRFLFKSQIPEQPRQGKTAEAFYDTIPDFADPYWLHEGERLPGLPAGSSTWLTVLGRDGYWPVALLKDPAQSSHACPLKTDDPNDIDPSTEASMCAPGHYDASSAGMNPPMPWLLAIVLSALLICLHAFRCSLFAGKYSYVSRAFEWKEDYAAGLLIAGATAFVFAIAAVLFIPVQALWDAPLWQPAGVNLGRWAFIFLFFAGAIVADRCARPYANRLNRPFVVGALLSLSVLFVFSDVSRINGNDVAYYYRAIHLSDGVDPLVPLLFLLAGLYGWAWQNLSGAKLMGNDRPRLPAFDHSFWKYIRAGGQMAKRIDDFARPLTLDWKVQTKILLTPSVIAILLLVSFQSSPVLSFDGSRFGQFTGLLLLAMLLLIATGSGRLLLTWMAVKQLLRQLDQMPLRRTFHALKGITGKSLWAITTNVPRTQYKFFAQQLDAATILKHEVDELVGASYDALKAALDDLLADGKVFSIDYLGKLSDTARWNRPIREKVAKCAGLMLSAGLSDAWDAEAQEKAPSKSDPTGDAESLPHIPLSDSRAVRAAEEFLCLLYISYLQTILARMRTMVMSISVLTVSMMLSLAFYPFAHRPLLAVWLLVILVAIGGVVAIVYVGLERDTVLSAITDTKTDLGWEFWSRYAAFLLPPLLALLTAQFPEVANTLQRWVQPGLDAVK